MVNSRIKIQKIIALILEMYFYSIIFLLVAKFALNMNVSMVDLRNSLLPFPFGNWFVVCYIILYFLIPFINLAIRSFSKKQFLRLICTYLLLFSIIPTLTGWSVFYNFIVFPLAYFVGAYIKLHVGKIDKKAIVKYLVVVLLLLASSVLAPYLISIILQKPELAKYSTHFLTANYSPLVIAAGTLIFLLFRDIKIKPSKTINRLAGSVLGVYLIHENLFMRRFLWGGGFMDVDIYDTSPWMFILLGAVKISLVLFACLVIDQMRILLLGKVEKKLSEAIYQKVVKLGVIFDKK